MSDPIFTFGIEEEYHLVDRVSRDIADAPDGLMAQCEAALGGQVSPEFLRSQIEVGTKPCRTVAEARADLTNLRRTVGRIAGDHGLAIMAASTHPFARATARATTDKARYKALESDLAGVGRRLAISGMHVHVGIDDDELRIDVMNQVRYFLPHLLVLSTSSPFWEGDDTGLKSFRVAISAELPRSGLPGRFAGWDEYQQTIGVLVRSKVIEDATKIWWDLRPSARFPTLEMRITDVCPRIEDALGIASLYVCLARMLWRLRRSNLSWRTYPVFLLAENRWRAQRYGVQGSLFDFGKGALVAFADLFQELIALVREDAEALGCWAEVSGLARVVADGTSADRQVAMWRAAIDAGKDSHAALVDVVDMLVTETMTL